MYNPNTVGYSFFENFFSDLGVLVTNSGASNLVRIAAQHREYRGPIAPGLLAVYSCDASLAV